MIAIINYQMGNLASVKNALDKLGYESIITSNKEEILGADKAILPGVGAFRDAMKYLVESGLDVVIKEFVKTGKPLLGICLGMQLLFEESYEYGLTKGLCILKGQIKHFEDCGLKIPHMGWNNLCVDKDFSLLEDGTYVYFVHSYHLVTKEKYTKAIVNYGYDFVAAVNYRNVYATQFHPEKSGNVGLKILKKFGDL